MPPVTSGRNAAKSPRDLTGRIHKAQQDARTKQLAEEAIPLQERLESEYYRGVADGDRIGVDAFKKALVRLYQREGIDAVREWLDEEVTA